MRRHAALLGHLLGSESQRRGLGQLHQRPVAEDARYRLAGLRVRQLLFLAQVQHGEVLFARVESKRVEGDDANVVDHIAVAGGLEAEELKVFVLAVWLGRESDSSLFLTNLIHETCRDRIAWVDSVSERLQHNGHPFQERRASG